jgi:hypothetical protein
MRSAETSEEFTLSPLRARLALTVAAASLLPTLSLLPTAPRAVASANDHVGVPNERPVDRTIGTADGEVRTIAQIGNRVVIGGTFTQVGPGIRGAVAPLDVASGAFSAGFPDVVGAVYAAVADGAGGWYLGGSFTSVGGVARTNAAQVDINGAVTGFVANTNGAVNAIAVDATGVYLGGAFTNVNGASTTRLVKRDLTTGAAVWNASTLNNTVRAVALSGTRVYVGGDFTTVGGVSRKRLAAVDSSTGVYDAGFANGDVNNTLRDLVVSGSNLYLAGDFTTVGGTTRQRLARVDLTSGALGSFNVTVNGAVYDIELDAAGSTIFAAGRFFTVGGVARKHVASVSTATNATTSLNVAGISSGDVNALSLDEGTGLLTFAGNFVIAPEKSAPAGLATIDISNNALARVVNPVANPASLARTPVGSASTIWRLIRNGGTIAVAGDFSDYGIVSRPRLAAFDLDTKALDLNFNPAPESPVYMVKGSTDGSSVFVGGEFATISGVARIGLAKLDLATGAADPNFIAHTNSYVKDLAVSPDGSRLYVGGNFVTINGTSRIRLAAVDTTTGAVDQNFVVDLTAPTNDQSEGGARALALSPDGSRLMVIGNFRYAAGLERPLAVQIDTTTPTATVTSWTTDNYDQPCARNKIGWMRDVDISPDGQTVYIVSAGHFYYPACDSANSFPMTPTGSNIAPTWTVKIGDTLEAVAATSDAVYIGGHFRYIETETQSDARFQVAALDPVTGRGLNWRPNADGQLGVRALESEPAGLFLGSDGDTVGTVPHGRFGWWAPATPGLWVKKTASRTVADADGDTMTYSIVVENTMTNTNIDVTSMTDTRLGNLGAACSLPQTLGPGATFSCSAGEGVSGDDLTTVSGTVTVSGTAGGSPVSDTDTSEVLLRDSLPGVRLRTINAPVTVPFPEGDSQFALIVMNLNQTTAMNFTALTSNLHGDLDGVGGCSVPQVIAANSIYRCTPWLTVGGPVGARISDSFTATANFGGGSSTSTAGASTTISAPPSGVPVLYVVGNPTVLGAKEITIRDRLALEYNVTIADDNTVTAADADGKALVVISSSINTGTLNTKLRDVETPVLLYKGDLMDEMGYTASSANQGSVTQTNITVTDVLHPLAAQRSGVNTVLNQARVMRWGNPGAQADIAAQLNVGQPALFSYDEGDLLANGQASPGCRVAFPLENSAFSNINTAGWAFWDRAVDYAASECGTNFIYTVAGYGSSGTYPGNGNPATTTPVKRPTGLDLGPNNNLVIVDTDNNAVRSVDLSTGAMTTLAGTGTAGYSGNGGQATSATLRTPLRAEYDAAGNLYIADTGNHAIRRVSAATGVITTVAGTGSSGSNGDNGPATSARLNNPSDVAFDSSGNFYIADRSNQKVRKVTIATGVITTFAGNGSSGYTGDDVAATSSRLNAPYAVDFDATDRLYIADYNNERVRMVDTLEIIHTVAGTGSAGTGGDGGFATEADLHKPMHVMVDPLGGLWITEYNNTKVRYVSPDGFITTIGGNTVLGFAGDGGPPVFSVMNRPLATVMDAAGNVYVADRDNRRVRLILKP